MYVLQHGRWYRGLEGLVWVDAGHIYPLNISAKKIKWFNRRIFAKLGREGLRQVRPNWRDLGRVALGINVHCLRVTCIVFDSVAACCSSCVLHSVGALGFINLLFLAARVVRALFVNYQGRPVNFRCHVYRC